MDSGEAGTGTKPPNGWGRLLFVSEYLIFVKVPVRLSAGWEESLCEILSVESAD